MALVGQITKHIYTPHPTETVDSSITFPIDLPEDHPHYEDRGTTVEGVSPKVEHTTEVYDNAYLVIHSLSLNPPYLQRDEHPLQEYNWVSDINYRVYTSENARQNNYSDFLFEGAASLHDVDLDSNLLTQAYTFLKTEQGFENLVNL